MIDKLRPYHPHIYFFCLTLLAVAMPFSKPVMSIAQILLLINWLIEGNLKSKINSFLRNKTALIISSIWILHLVGLIYTADIDYGIKDAKTKFPLFLLPLIISTSVPLSAKQLKMLLLFFVSAIVANTLIGIGALYGLFKKEITDVRGISLFVSHIRFGLMICLSVFIMFFYFKKESKLSVRIILALLIVWTIIFLFILESLTGIFVLITAIFITGSFYIFNKGKTWMKIIFPIAIISAGIFLFQFLKAEIEAVVSVKQKIDFNQIDSRTKNGKKYLHDINNTQAENGYYVGLFICLEETESEWNKRSKIKFNENDKKGNEIRFTILRYLTSKGLRKDAEGVKSLNENDISFIESGAANCNYTNFSSIRSRIHEIVWELNEYKSGRNSSGHSLTQRLEFWKTSFDIIEENIFFGVGTGDPPSAFKMQYIKNNSQLKEKFRLRSHNQFFAIAVSFGIIGLIWFLFCLIYPFVNGKIASRYFYSVFIIIVALSFVNEDTLESQAGVTFFALFNSLFLFCSEKKVDHTES